MKIWNCLACCCSCNSWCSGCCAWYCVYTIWSIAVQQCNKSHGARLILLLLCFICTPFLCLSGCINCIQGIGTVCEHVKAFCDTDDIKEGYKRIIIPEESGPYVEKTNEFIDKCFTC